MGKLEGGRTPQALQVVTVDVGGRLEGEEVDVCQAEEAAVVPVVLLR